MNSSKTDKKGVDQAPDSTLSSFRVFIVGDNKTVAQMFMNNGHRIVKDLEDDVEIVVFTGGEDVTPLLYGERIHDKTNFSIERDMRERKLWASLPTTLPKVGICRGGQFLNVMSGGSLWQHVDNHVTMKTHPATTISGDIIQVSSTHHQMMRPSKEAFTMLYSDLCTFKETDTKRYEKKDADWGDLGDDIVEEVEACYYLHTNSFCFQPHPEYPLGRQCRPFFFQCIEEMFGKDIEKLREYRKKRKEVTK